MHFVFWDQILDIAMWHISEATENLETQDHTNPTHSEWPFPFPQS